MKNPPQPRPAVTLKSPSRMCHPRHSPPISSIQTPSEHGEEARGTGAIAEHISKDHTLGPGERVAAGQEGQVRR